MKHHPDRASANPMGTWTHVALTLDGATLVGTATAAPYSVSLANPAPGTHSLTALATDNQGAVTTSAAVSISVNTPPTVSLSAPAADAVFNAPGTITVTATAADADGTLGKVEFFQGGTLITTLTAAPFTFQWTGVPSGAYSLTAVATDNQGAVTTSAAVAIRVNAIPTVSLASPANGATFTAPATIALAATATDTDGALARVDFFQGTTLVGTATTEPYTFTLNSVAAGTYSFTAVATDSDGATTTSAAVGVTVGSGVAQTQIYFIHPDHLNTPRLIANNTGTTVWRWDQAEPFGSTPPNNNPAGAGTFEFNLRFPGQYFDREMNLAYNYFRDYDPSTGRYVRSDPIGLRGGLNTYAYVGGNPISYIDPLGLDRWGDTSANYRYTPTAGMPVNSGTGTSLTCFSICVGGNKPGPGVSVTAGRQGGHSPGSAHQTGQACDIGKNSNPGLDRSTAESCFQQCFAPSSSYGQEEGNHYHFQSRPGAGGATGFAPGVH